jgi:hypothetical protein
MGLCVFCGRYDTSTGTRTWTKQLGGSGSDIANSVAVTSSAVFVAGRTFNSLLGQTHLGSGDGFVVKYTSKCTCSCAMG